MNNFDSYSVKDVVEYYNTLANKGLFNYEKIIFNKYLKPHTKILDIGCGCGRICKMLENDYETTGIDYSKEMIEKAQLNTKNTVLLVLDVVDLQKIHKKFDVIIFSFNGLMLIHSYENRKTVLNAIKKHLSKNGLFIFTTPFLDNKINGDYWKEKIASFNKGLFDFSEEEYMVLGDEIVNEDIASFAIHIPFLKEIFQVLHECKFSVVFSGRRIDYFGIEDLEDELDDNYIWVVKTIE